MLLLKYVSILVVAVLCVALSLPFDHWSLKRIDTYFNYYTGFQSLRLYSLFPERTENSPETLLSVLLKSLQE